MTKEFPRRIDASLIEIGDKIAVTRSLGNGVTQTLTGTVARRADQGMTREYRTSEGGVLVAWEPKRRVPVVTLLDRIPAPQTALYGSEEWFPERLEA